VKRLESNNGKKRIQIPGVMLFSSVLNDPKMCDLDVNLVTVGFIGQLPRAAQHYTSITIYGKLYYYNCRVSSFSIRFYFYCNSAFYPWNIPLC